MIVLLHRLFFFLDSQTNWTDIRAPGWTTCHHIHIFSGHEVTDCRPSVNTNHWIVTYRRGIGEHFDIQKSRVLDSSEGLDGGKSKRSKTVAFTGVRPLGGATVLQERQKRVGKKNTTTVNMTMII